MNRGRSKHMMGKRCGYDLFEDGSIRIADSHSLMDEAMHIEQGLQAFISATNVHLAKQFENTARLRSAFWKGVRDDYGLDFEKYEYSYEPFDKIISKKIKEKKVKK